MRTRDYSGIGKALLVLGSLLYTLSIFLIAQIFATSTSWQGQAWLWLLAWVGVVVSAYIFQSNYNYAISIVEYLIWVLVQSFAFFELNSLDSGFFGHLVLVIAFIITGIKVGISAFMALDAKRRESES
jgi:uncharacterized membrane protein